MGKVDIYSISEAMQGFLKLARLSYRSILIGISLDIASAFLQGVSLTLSGILMFIGLGALMTGIIELHRFIKKLKTFAENLDNSIKPGI